MKCLPENRPAVKILPMVQGSGCLLLSVARIGVDGSVLSYCSPIAWAGGRMCEVKARAPECDHAVALPNARYTRLPRRPVF